MTDEVAETVSHRVGFGLALAIAAVAVVSGAAAVSAGVRPVVSESVSAVLVAAAVSFVVLIGSLGEPRVIGWASLAAGVAQWSLVGVLIGQAGFLLAQVGPTYLGRRLGPSVMQPSARLISAAVAGLSMNLVARSELPGPLGTPTIAAVAIAIFVIAVGMAGLSTALRRTAIGLIVAVVLVGVLSAALFGALASSVSNELSAGEKRTREGIRHLGAADLDAAREAFRIASGHFSTAEDRLDSVVGDAGALVPVVSQHRYAAMALSAEAARSTTQVAELLDELGDDALSMGASQIDLDAVESFSMALADMQESLDRLDATIVEASSPWLVDPIQPRLERLDEEIVEQQVRTVQALDVVEQLPGLLGGEEERTYLVLFTTPAEARGLGGFTGNWAEITVDDGAITLSGFGRADEIDDAAPEGARRLTAPEDWLRRYGRFGFTTGPGGTVGADPFKNVTMSPSMSSTGRVVADLYAQSGGSEVDGVFAMDVYVLAELLRYTGPVDVPGAPRRINRSNAVEFLLNRQYIIPEKDDRIDAIADASFAVVDQLFGETSIPPSRLLSSLGPLVAEGRLAGWVVDPTEQALFERTGLAGTMLAPDSDDFVTVALNNAAGNKIDYYLTAEGRYDASVSADGDVGGVFEMSLENHAPSEGQPRYVIGNAIDEPRGSNRTYVSVYTSLPVSEVELDGEPVTTESEIEAGYFVTSALVDLASGERRTLTVRTNGQVDVDDGYSLVVRSPPIVGDMPIDVTVVAAGDGQVLNETSLDGAGRTRIEIADVVPQT